MQSRGKEILLLLLAVAALGVALYTFRGKSAPTAASKPTAAATKEGQQEVAAAPKEQATTEEAGAAGTTDASRNPFSAPEGPAPEGAQPGPKTAGAASGGETGEGQQQLSAPGEGAGVGPPPAPPQPVDTGLKLVGTLTGPSPLAVIRYGDKPYYVHVNDKVADTYRVKAIGADGEVVLVGQQGTIVLRKGK